MRPTPVQRLIAAVPPALLVGILFMIAGDFAVSLYEARITARDHEALANAWARSGLIGTTLWVSTTAMIAIGLHEAARRAAPADRGVLLAAAILVWLVVARAMVSMIVQYGAHVEQATVLASFRWGSRVTSLGWIGSAVLIALALRRRDPAIFLGLGAALIVTALLAHPPRFLREWFYFDGYQAKDLTRNAALGFAYGFAAAAVLVVALVQILEREPPLPGDVVRVAGGLGRAGTALVARIVVAMGFAFAMCLAIVAKSPGLLKLALVLVALGSAAASIAMITGVFQGGGNAGAAAPPRLRFAAAGGLLLASLVLVAIQSVVAYRLARAQVGGELDFDFEHRTMKVVVEAFPYLGPAIAVAGLLCLISALASLRTQRGPILGSADPSTAAALVVTFSVASVAVQRWSAGKGIDTGSYLVLLIVLTVAQIVAQIAVARLCHKIADGLLADGPTTLPAARIHNPDEE